METRLIHCALRKSNKRGQIHPHHSNIGIRNHPEQPWIVLGDVARIVADEGLGTIYHNPCVAGIPSTRKISEVRKSSGLINEINGRAFPAEDTAQFCEKSPWANLISRYCKGFVIKGE